LTHSTTSINVTILAHANDGTADEGFAMRNFFLYIDTCDTSCLTCYGPTSVRECFNNIFTDPESKKNKKTNSYLTFFRQTA